MIKFLRRLLGQGSTNNRHDQTRHRLEAAKQAALQPTLYAQWGVPDTFDGRFEAVLLMVCVDFARLNRDGDAPSADALLAAFMEDVELALQASGVSEGGMRKKMRAVETSCFARVERIGGPLRAQASTVEEITNSMFGAQEDTAGTAAKLDTLLHRLYASERGIEAASAVVEEMS